MNAFKVLDQKPVCNSHTWFVILTHKILQLLEVIIDSNYFIFRHNDRKVNSKNMAFTLQSNLAGMCATGQCSA